jgi:hypothetical protein
VLFVTPIPLEKKEGEVNLDELRQKLCDALTPIEKNRYCWLPEEVLEFVKTGDLAICRWLIGEILDAGPGSGEANRKLLEIALRETQSEKLRKTITKAADQEILGL